MKMMNVRSIRMRYKWVVTREMIAGRAVVVIVRIVITKLDVVKMEMRRIVRMMIAGTMVAIRRRTWNFNVESL